MRTGLGIAVLACLVGAGMVLLAGSRAWVTTRVGAAPPLPGRSVALTGTTLVPGARALALVGLAAVAALPATRRWGRLTVGVLLVLAGSGIVVVVARELAESAAALGGWPYVTILGGLLLATAGGLAILRGRRWAAMGDRYESPAAPRAGGDASLWDSIDRGEDPTR